MDTQPDKSFWTSPFKKLLKSTEDDKTLRIINRLVKKALTGNTTDEEKIVRKTYAKEKFHVSKKNASINRTIKEKRNVRISFNESLNSTYNIEDENTPELHRVNIYETVKLEKPKIIDITPKEAVDISKFSKKRKPLIEVFDINFNNLEEISSYPEEKEEPAVSSYYSPKCTRQEKTEYYPCGSKKNYSLKNLEVIDAEVYDINYNNLKEISSYPEDKEEPSVSSYYSPECPRQEKTKYYSCGSKKNYSFHNLEVIDAEVLDKTYEIPEYASPIKTPKNSTLEPIYATIDEDWDRIFVDTQGNVLSPIKKFPQKTIDAEERFIINLYKNKPADTPRTNIVQKTNSANITPDKSPQRTPKSRNPNRVVTRAIMEEFTRLETVSLDDLVKELSLSAEKLETVEYNEVKYENSKIAYEECKKDCCSFISSQTKLVEVAPQKKQETNNNSNAGFFKLKQKADIECKVMRQASKALDLCRERGNGIKDIEVAVEAEKILLTAACRYEKILREIRQDHYENPIKFNNVGTVEIREIRAEIQTKSLDEWYVCILSNEEGVFCTKPTQCEKDSNLLIFDDWFTFKNLDSNFEIKLEFYSLRVKRKGDESRIRKKNKFFTFHRTFTRASRKLFYKDLHTQSLVESNIPASSFKSRGVVKLNVSNLTQISHCVKRFEGSSLEKFVDITAHIAEVTIGEDRVGFLTIGTENTSAINWNRRWCALNGCYLKCWNYPNEEHSKKPVEILDLSDCVLEITNARRSWCPRPKTLLVEMGKNERKYLNTDTVQDLHDWKNTLNRVYITLYNWKMLQNQQGIYI